ncbi:MAG: hypothetical protein ACAI25_15160, partial [Planctomycetota bacterium]
MTARGALVLALALLAPGAARAQTAPPLEAERRLYVFEDALSLDHQEHLVATIAALESRSGRHFFVIVSRDPAIPLARVTAGEWKRRAADDPQAPWHPDSSVLLTATSGTDDAAIEMGAPLRDRLGLSPFTLRDQVVGPHFQGPAKRGELAAALEKLLEAVGRALSDAEQAFGRESVAGLDEGEKGPPVEGVS